MPDCALASDAPGGFADVGDVSSDVAETADVALYVCGVDASTPWLASITDEGC